ncbi:MAG: cupin domain-containing protein [Cytophagaceae bacterium]
MKAADWIKKLNLLPHPEGGYYRETYRSSATIPAGRFDKNRNVSTAIYFLLEEKNKSHFHRIKSDELWFFHEGAALEILMLDEAGLKIVLLGKNAEAGESLQAIVPAHTWFAARLRDQKDFALVSCTVAPGFEFADFELGKKQDMKKRFPQYEKLLDEMCIN